MTLTEIAVRLRDETINDYGPVEAQEMRRCRDIEERVLMARYVKVMGSSE